MNSVANPVSSGTADRGILPSDSGIVDYLEIIKRACELRNGIDYPNSTVAHAEVAISQIVNTCKLEIGVFSRCFSGRFWNKLSVGIQDFLNGDKSRKFKVITIKPIDSEAVELVTALRNAFPNQFNLKTLRSGIIDNPDDCVNFLYGDEFATRFEECDSDAKKGLVSAIVNFGNEDRARHLKALFNRLQETTA